MVGEEKKEHGDAMNCVPDLISAWKFPTQLLEEKQQSKKKGCRIFIFTLQVYV